MKVGEESDVTKYTTMEPKNFSELLREIESYQKKRSDVWYRGVSKESYDLIPTLARIPRRKTEEELDGIEKGIATAFAQRSPPFVEKDLSGEWRNLFFMQHYGIPTRLLDWSESPFVGLYFALANVERSKTGIVRNDVALWMCDPVKWNSVALSHISYKGGILDETCDEIKAYSPDLNLDQRATTPVMIYGTHNSSRIVAQRGVFALFGKGMKSMQTTFEEGDFENDTLKKIRIKKSSVDEILDSLVKKGFTESTIFPDLFGLSLEIKRRFGYR